MEFLTKDIGMSEIKLHHGYINHLRLPYSNPLYGLYFADMSLGLYVRKNGPVCQ